MRQKDLSRLLGVSVRTIRRVVKKLGLKWRDIGDKELVLIADEVRKKGFLMYRGQNDLFYAQKRGQNDLNSFENIITLLEKILTTIQVLLEKTTVMLEKIILVEREVSNKNLSLDKDNIIKDIINAIKEYMVRNDIYNMTLNDMFLELLGKYEKDKNKNVRKNYLKQDRNYYHTLVRMGLASDFIEYVRRQI